MNRYRLDSIEQRRLLASKLQQYAAYCAIIFVFLADLYIYYCGIGAISSLLLLATGFALLVAFLKPYLMYPLWQASVNGFDVVSKLIFSTILALMWLIILPYCLVLFFTKRQAGTDNGKRSNSYWQIAVKNKAVDKPAK